MRDLAAHYPPPDLLRGALNLGRGTGRVKALLQLAGGPLSVSGLAEAVSVDAPYATLIVDTLEERGLVERRSDPADRRRKLVELTPAGQEAIGRVERILREPPEGFADLSPRELDVLEDLVTRITARSAPAPRTRAMLARTPSPLETPLGSHTSLMCPGSSRRWLLGPGAWELGTLLCSICTEVSPAQKYLPSPESGVTPERVVRRSGHQDALASGPSARPRLSRWS